MVVGGKGASCPLTAARDRFCCCWLIFCTLPPFSLGSAHPQSLRSPVSSPPGPWWTRCSHEGLGLCFLGAELPFRWGREQCGEGTGGWGTLQNPCR